MGFMVWDNYFAFNPKDPRLEIICVGVHDGIL